MQKKILIAALALSLFAIAIVVFTSSNQERQNEDNIFVGKIQNEVAASQAVENSTHNTVVNELIALDTKPQTINPQENEATVSEDKLVAETPNIDTPLAENTNVETPKVDTSNLMADNSAIPAMPARTNATEPMLSVTASSVSTEQGQDINSGLAATKPPLESLLFKSGDNNMPAPKINPKEKNENLSTNKLEKIPATKPEKSESANIVEPPKTQDSKAIENAPKIETTNEMVKASESIEPKVEPKSSEAPKTEDLEDKKAKVLVTSTKLKANAQNPTITATKLEMNGDVVNLRLEGNQALGAKTYILNNPDRVVLDLNAKYAISVPMVISNRMVKSIRVGEQDSGTRIVFDMLVPAQKSDVRNIDASTLELTIR